MRNVVYVTGHKNPDSDSICAAYAYAEFKNKTGEIPAIPVRLGNVSRETQFILDYFGAEAPEYLETVKLKVEDLKIDNIWGEQTNNAVKKLPLCGLLYVQRELTTWVQLRLGETADGIFGIKTERAVKTWQRDHNIMVDGIVGYNTYKSLALA